MKAENRNFKPHQVCIVSSEDIYKRLRIIKTKVLQRVKFELEHLPCKKLYFVCFILQSRCSLFAQQKKLYTF